MKNPDLHLVLYKQTTYSPGNNTTGMDTHMRSSQNKTFLGGSEVWLLLTTTNSTTSHICFLKHTHNVKAAANNTQVSRTKTTKDNAAWKAQQTVSKLQKKNSRLETDRIRFSKAWISTDSGPSLKRSRRNPVRLSNARNALVSLSLSSRAPSLTRACVRTNNRWVFKLPNGSLPYPTYNLSYPGVVNTQSGSNFVITDQ